MKKVIAFVLIVTLLLSLSSCGSGVSYLAYNRFISQDITNDTTNIGDIIQFGGINWRILEIQDGSMLIISEEILECRAYDDSYSIWETSDIREYLNGEFINQRFTEDERALIIETLLTNDDTYDKLFLLNLQEANRYFSDDADRIAYDSDGTAYWWWLRSRGSYSFTAASVSSSGQIHMGDYVYLNVWTSLGIRPALWLSVVYSV